MASLRAFLVPVLFFVATYPFAAFAAETNFFGPIIPQAGDKCYCPGTAMDWGCLLQVFQGVMNLLISLGVLAVVFFIAWAGFLMITGGSSPANRTKAKNRLINAVIGLVVILGAWLIVDTVMKTLYNPDAGAGEIKFGPWNSIFAGEEASYCLDKNNTPGGLTDGGLLGVVNPGTTQSTTGGNVPGGPIAGSFTYDKTDTYNVADQKPQASAALTSVLNCMAGKLKSGTGRISAITDSTITNNQHTIAQCAASGKSIGCMHTVNSCHYGGRTCIGRSFAADFGDQEHAAELQKAAISCGADVARVEDGNHVHVSVSNKACGCN